MPTGAKAISQFADGSPLQSGDEFVFERAGVTLKVSQANLLVKAYAAGSITVPTGNSLLLAGMLQLTGTQVLTMKGNSILRITGNV